MTDPPAPIRVDGTEAAERIAELVEQGRPVVVRGEGGSGKSASTYAALGASGRTACVAQCSASLSWMPLAPFDGLVEAYDGIDELAHRLIDRVGAGVLVVEDAHLADEDSLQLTGRLRGEVRLVVTTRPTGGAEQLGLLQGHASVVELHPLGDEAARRVVRGLRPQLDDDELASIVGRASGNLLALTELTRRGGPSPTWQLLARSTLDSLRPEDRHGLELLALLGRPVDPSELALDTEALIEQELVTRRADGTITPRHALWADQAISSLAAGPRADRERELGDRLTDPAEAAHHLLLGGDRPGATAAALEALTKAVGRRTRATLLRLAADASGKPELRVEAAEALVAVQHHADAAEILAGVELSGDLLARAWGCRAATALDQVDYEGVLDAVTAGLAARPSAEVELGLRETRLDVLLMTWAVGEAADEAEHVVRLQEQVEPDRPQTELLLARLRLTQLRPDWRPHVERVKARTDQPVAVLEALQIEFTGAAFFEGPAKALEILERGRQLAADGGYDEARIRFQGIELYTRLLSLSDTAAAVELGESLLAEPLIQPDRFHLLWPLGFAHAERGEPRLARRLLMAAAELAPGPSMSTVGMRWARAEAELVSGHLRRAIAACELLITDRPLIEPVVGPLADLTLAWARLAHTGTSRIDLGNVLFPVHQGAIPEATGLAALDRGAVDQAADAFTEAATVWQGWNQRSRIRCLWAAGESARRAGDAPTARTLLATADDEADRCGLRPAQALIRRSLAAAGERRPLPQLSPAGEDGLSPAERDVLDLVAGGHTSRSVAEQLGVSSRTVDAVVGRAMTKLGARTRLEAAVMAAAPIP